MARLHRFALVLVPLLAACASAPAPVDLAQLRAEVIETETAFAQTMARRDHPAFATFIAEDAVFFNGATSLRGRAAVVDAWRHWYSAPQAPFSWAPERVEVLATGSLALSSGPVHDPQGKRIGSFSSIWRREAPGVWRIVFDKGENSCEPEAH